MMYEQRDAVQNTKCSSPESLGILCVYAYVRVFLDVCLTLTHCRLVIYTVTQVCVQFPVKQGDRLLLLQKGCC